MDLIQQDKAQDVPKPGDRASPGQGVRAMRRGDGAEGSRQSAQELVVMADHGEVHCAALLDGRIGEPLRDAASVGVVGHRLAALGPVVLAVGVLAVSEELRPFPRERQPAPEEIPGGAHLGRIDRGLGEHATAPEDSHLVRIDPIVFGFAAMDGLHIEGMAADERHAVLGTAVGEPVPGQQAFDGDHQIIAIGGNDLMKGLRTGFHMVVHDDLSGLIQETNIHGPSVQVDATIKLVRLGVESPEVSSSS
jgi:hypothetical protein